MLMKLVLALAAVNAVVGLPAETASSSNASSASSAIAAVASTTPTYPVSADSRASMSVESPTTSVRPSWMDEGVEAYHKEALKLLSLSDADYAKSRSKAAQGVLVPSVAHPWDRSPKVNFTARLDPLVLDAPLGKNLFMVVGGRGYSALDMDSDPAWVGQTSFNISNPYSSWTGSMQVIIYNKTCAAEYGVAVNNVTDSQSKEEHPERSFEDCLWATSERISAAMVLKPTMVLMAGCLLSLLA